MKISFIKNNPIRFCVIILSGIVFLISAFMLIKTALDYNKGVQTYNSITQQVVTPVSSVSSTADAPVVSTQAVDINTPPISIDFAKLKKINQDIIGWIYCPDTPINYPIVDTDSDKDYDLYLKTSVDGKQSVSGSIFLDYRNSADLTDLNTIIYGHSMKNGTMFAYLLRYDDQDFYDNHKHMWLFTEFATYRIDVISGMAVKTTSEDYIIYTDQNEFHQYLNNSIKKSMFKSDVNLSDVGNIITLSTCAYSSEDSRYVVLGNMVKID